jgi:hypothetical protein
MTEQIKKTIYWIDRKKRIISVSDLWDRFAQENGGSGISATDVQGRSLWDFVIGDTARMWLEALLQLTVLKNETVVRPYRCDSHQLKRYMQMHLVPEDSGILKVEHVLLSTENRIVPVFIRHSPQRSNEHIHARCSVCGRIENNQLWEEPDLYKSSGSIHLNVIYTVCPDCLNTLPQVLAKNKLKAQAD